MTSATVALGVVAIVFAGGVVGPSLQHAYELVRKDRGGRQIARAIVLHVEKDHGWPTDPG
jgi:hypothetical protein